MDTENKDQPTLDAHQQELEKHVHQAELMEAKLIELQDQLNSAKNAKQEFLANMNHEFRTPLNGIMGMVGLLLETELDSEQKEYAQTIKDCSDSLMAITRDILDFSKIEAKKLDLHMLDFDLRTAIYDVIHAISYQSEEKGLIFKHTIDHQVPSSVKGDPGRLRQVLNNILTNAFKFTKKGQVSLQVNLEKETESNAIIRIIVSDTGVGISKDGIEKLFGQFSQIDASSTRHYGGTGLGLVISKELIKKMGGEVSVESELYQGTTFSFSVHLEKQTQKSEYSVDVHKDLAGKNILVAHGNAMARKVFQKYLSAWQCKYEIVDDGIKAQNVLISAAQENEHFDFAIVNMKLPKIDGESLGILIKKTPEIKDTILIMTTALGKRGDAARVQEIGFSAYLTTPITHILLFDCLIELLNARARVQNGNLDIPLVTRHSLLEVKKRQVKILLAEDNLVNQKLALKLLEKLGYKADIVMNGQKAVEALEKIPYSLVLMDVQMPDMDGFEATKIIRNPESNVINHKVPIIALTAHAMEGYRDTCLSVGMNDYVTKPLNPGKLATVIEQFLLIPSA